MTRIAIGGFLHETNTFAPTKATYADFVHGGGWPAMAHGADMSDWPRYAHRLHHESRTGKIPGRQRAGKPRLAAERRRSARSSL